MNLQLPALFEPVTEAYIYNSISQEEVFRRYLNVNIVIDKKIISPLRNDKRPTATFGYTNGVLLFTDWNGEFSGNCIMLVMYLFNLNYWKAMNKIAIDFNIPSIKQGSAPIKKANLAKVRGANKEFTASWGELEPLHVGYFKQCGISIQTLKYYNVYKLNALWMNGELLYLNTISDPAVLYLEDDWFKTYFYTRSVSRFLSQGSGIQGLMQLKFQSNKLIIQKSLKDVMLMHELGFESIAPPSENTYITELQIRMLQDKYHEIIVIMDNDKAGITAMKYYQSLGLRTVTIPNKKDSTDYCKAFGIKKTETILNNLIYV